MNESFEQIDKIINRILAKDLSPEKISQKAQNREIIENWEKIAGKEIAKNSVPVRIINNELIVQVNSPSLLFYLKRFKSKIILTNLQKRWSWIKAIRFKAS